MSAKGARVTPDPARALVDALASLVGAVFVGPSLPDDYKFTITATAKELRAIQDAYHDARATQAARVAPAAPADPTLVDALTAALWETTVDYLQHPGCRKSHCAKCGQRKRNEEAIERVRVARVAPAVEPATMAFARLCRDRWEGHAGEDKPSLYEMALAWQAIPVEERARLTGLPIIRPAVEPAGQGAPTWLVLMRRLRGCRPPAAVEARPSPAVAEEPGTGLLAEVMDALAGHDTDAIDLLCGCGERDGKGYKVCRSKPGCLLSRVCAALSPSPAAKPNGVSLIAAERQRQVTAEGWTPEHDDEHTQGELAQAAASYATHGNRGDGDPELPPPSWPWDARWWKPAPRAPGSHLPAPSDRVRELVKAGALIAAEIDRLLRRSPAPAATATGEEPDAVPPLARAGELRKGAPDGQ